MLRLIISAPEFNSKIIFFFGKFSATDFQWIQIIKESQSESQSHLCLWMNSNDICIVFEVRRDWQWASNIDLKNILEKSFWKFSSFGNSMGFFGAIAFFGCWLQPATVGLSVNLRMQDIILTQDKRYECFINSEKIGFKEKELRGGTSGMAWMALHRVACKRIVED